MVDASPGARPRPLSPHVMHWRWHVTMAASILNRLAGAALYAGWLVLGGWALALASGREAYDRFGAVLTSIPGQALLFAVALALFFHLAAGVRHLFWDFGSGFAPRKANLSAMAAAAFALIAAAALFGVAHLAPGAGS